MTFIFFFRKHPIDILMHHYATNWCFSPLLLINAQLIYKQKIRWIDGPKPYKSKTDIRYIHNTSNKKESETYKGEHCSRKKIPFRTADRFPNLNNVRYWFPTISLFHSLWYYQPILETALKDNTKFSSLQYQLNGTSLRLRQALQCRTIIGQVK